LAVEAKVREKAILANLATRVTLMETPTPKSWKESRLEKVR